ncbi:amidohydrolase [Chelativorans sp. ZYF759]|uniref:M20 aminoacylase family protein n=1 Tax=Chelativorans sp. ZYF759 TaxID=2692213 RepID=UPI00145DCCC4|nr:M20 aminoacylase family protein [Chelativorans sp. ZYF759]NMG38083.1 amidohydrolase [Chelativorans sp. ZYF759]
MPILNRAAELQDEVAEWRQHIHRHPELGYQEHETSAFVAEKLRAFGCDDVVTGMGRTGVVGIIRGSRGVGPTIGLRADMDALPITELSGKPYASSVPGKMHACGHDGHTAMLLGAAKYLAETRNFAGSVAVIFQPAEEGGGGGLAMVQDGLMERFGIQSVFGMHNLPGRPVGHFALRPGAIMAATAEFKVKVTGRGGHAAMPHETVDPIVAASQMVAALQTITSRNLDPVASLVISVTKFNAGHAYNVIPDTAEFAGTIRSLDDAVGAKARERLTAICQGIAAAAGAMVEVEIDVNYPVTFNHEAEAALALSVAAAISGADAADGDLPPMMGGEDFSYMLQKRPGAMIFLGNGNTASLHNPAYDFNDEIIPTGISYWVKLAETTLAA